jgi:asparaginyl-tRNA synthetase
VRERCRTELVTLERDVQKLEAVTPPFPRVSYTDAVRMVQEAGETLAWGDDFGAPHEAIISGRFEKPVFVHRFPSATKAFYMRPDPDDPQLSLSADLLAPEGYGEIIGGGERLSDLATLERRLEEHKLPRDAFEWYLDLRRYGSVPHAGFGLGIERTLSYVCGLDHVRETIPFPRMLYRLRP